MKHILLIVVMIFLVKGTSHAQLPDGSTAPDWTHTDIFNNTHHLYSLLDEGKMVVIEFSATWCGPCWNYMLTGALEDFWEEHGPNGTNQAQVFYIEADQSTGMADLLGQTPTSQGNWVAAIPFPIIDLQVGENTDNLYQINYYPTLYAVCSDKKIYELGQVPASEWEEFIQSCALTAEVSDIEEAVCYGEGSVTIESSGGITPITYEWNTGNTGPVLSNIGAGTYSVTVTEGNGREIEIEDIIVTGADEPVSLSDSNIEPAECFGTSTGGVSVEVGEGIPPFEYDWSNGSQAQNLINVPAGDYTLVVTDANGCTLLEAFEVTEPEELVAQYETTPEYCDQTNGTVSLDIEGGVGGYEVFASDGNVNGFNVTDLPAGFVEITVQDNNGCTWEENVNVAFTAEHDIYFSPNPQVTCAQPTTVVSGYVNSGSGEFAYAWSTTNGNIVGPTNQASVTVDQDGDYDLNVYDLITGCDVTNTVEVEAIVLPPVIAAGEDTPISCEILQPVLQGTGDPGYMISWSTPDGNIVSGGDTYTPTVDQPGTYILHVTNPANACTNVDTVAVLNQLNPAAAAFTFQTSSLTIMGTDVSTGSNLSGYNWTFGDGNSSTDPNVVHTYATSGSYEVCLSVQNGCATSQSCQQVEVTFVGSVLTVDATIHGVACNGDTTGSIVINVNGGSGNYTYVWTGPDGETYTTPNIENLGAGTYQLVVTDDQGNVYIEEFTINEPTAIILASSTVVDNLCYGETNGSILVEVSGGIGPYSYSFNGGPSQAENFILNLPGGIIECFITDANGCPFLAGPYSIQEPEQLVVTQTDVQHPSNPEVNNGSIILQIQGGVAPYTVTWNTGATGDTLTGLVPGEYTYSITDANGCVWAISDPILLLGSVSTTPVDLSRHISVLPNPSHGDVQIRWEGLDFGQGQLRLISLEGKQLLKQPISAANGKWDIAASELSTGIYFVMLEINQQIVPIKLVKF